jgi:hypothetical protein
MATTPTTSLRRRPGRDARAAGETVARHPAFEWLARLGLVARGGVYGIIGALALALALGAGGKATNQQGALKTIADGPLGKVALVVLALGLGGYALWRIVRAAIGHGPEQSDSGFDRVAALASGIAYGILFVTAVSLLFTSQNKGSSGHPDKTTAGVMDWTGGQLLVGAAGVIMLGVALYQCYKGLSRDFLDDSKTEQMSPEVKRSFTVLGVVGHVSRGVVFGLVGWFLLRAAIDFDPKKAVGLDGALAKLAHTGYGPVLLGIVAAGLIAFGCYSVADAKFRRI